jgi:hypothetical protein
MGGVRGVPNPIRQLVETQLGGTAGVQTAIWIQVVSSITSRSPYWHRRSDAAWWPLQL